MVKEYDAIIIGSGSNGLAAAIHLQQKGLKTAVYEQASTPGVLPEPKNLPCRGLSTM